MKTTEKIQPFDITFLNNTIGNIDSYRGKPLVLEWGASWCITCDDTQRALRDIYPLYKDSSNFVSISYGGSGDTIEKFSAVKNKGSYQWTFALDHTNFAATIPIGPGTLWILDSNFNLINDWRGVILTSTDIQNALNKLLSIDDQKLLVNPEGGAPGSFQVDNPLFIVFMFLAVGLVISIGVLKLKSQGSMVNAEQEISKSGKRLENELAHLKTIVSEDKNDKSNLNQKPRRKRVNQRRGNRR